MFDMFAFTADPYFLSMLNIQMYIGRESREQPEREGWRETMRSS